MEHTSVTGLRVFVLRGVEARRDGVALEVPGRRLRSLLALLALTPGVPRRPEYLADQLWDGEPPSANALQALISRLRRVLGTDAVVSRPHGYLLAVAAEQVDLARFDRLLAEGTPAAAREALALAGPEPLAEFADVPDLADESRRIEAECWKARALAERAPAVHRAPPATVHRAAPAGVRLIGRDVLIAEITARLGTTRLVTLVGAGGAGKTSVAKAVAYAHDGAVVAELAPVGADAVAAEVLTAVGGRDLMVTERARRAADHRDYRTRVAATLADRSMLLVLDNCEHVVDAAADLAALILERCPRVTILTTSREPLAVPGEVRLPVNPLPVPPVDAEHARLGDYAAMQLLLERGRAVRPDLATDGADGEALAEICRRLDGIPLALELAAARFSLLTARQVADRLDDRFRLLTAGARTALPRQQTLRAVVDWSWELLDGQEREVLAACSVFVGGASLEDVEAVAGAEVLDVLGRLVAKSLVVADRLDDGAMRYRLLETIREYARARLAESGCERAARDRHAAYYARLAAEADPQLRGADQLRWIHLLDTEDDNLRAALAWALKRADAVTALSLSTNLSWYWMLRGRRDTQPLFAAVAELAEREGPTDCAQYAIVLALCAITSFDTGTEIDDSMALLNRSSAVFRGCGGYHTIAVLVDLLLSMSDAKRLADTVDRTQAAALAEGREWDAGLILMFRSRLLADEDTAAAEACTRKALELFRRVGDRWGIAESGQALGYVQSLRGEHRAALETFAEAGVVAEQLGATGDLGMIGLQRAWEHEFLGEPREADRIMELTERRMADRPGGVELRPYLLLTRAELARRRGDLETAAARLAESRKIADRGHFGPFRGQYEITAGFLAVCQGRPREAAGHFRDGLIAATTLLYDRSDVAFCIQGLAAAAEGAGQARQAAVLLGAVGVVRPAPLPAARQVDVARVAVKTRGALAPDEYERAFAEGRALTAQAALALARECAASLSR
ncbi:winged helix-turn-helix domain-containing protein [Actinocrinis puniceicyclus]|uniref:Winged helix-turn-helix domain-containing protein n=1 Tax=Actinocrinis puniceicyclus TaxID=977794 RepID=A0A8J8BBG9_9ACTN|nr:winged helix-turn-helix domain-containing protein [Actinocrinis puniceicyclus]MBS2962455.1 winged helix-turn-helix domain-containing protein [Actinocrinis puniceicyclus]